MGPANVCGAQCKIKMGGCLFKKSIMDLKMITEDHKAKCGALLCTGLCDSTGPEAIRLAAGGTI